MDAMREALRALVEAAPDPSFVRQAALDDDSDQACMIEEGARAYREALARARSVLSQEPGGALTTKTRPEGCSCECYPETEDQEDIDLECPCCHAAKGEFCRHPA